MRRRRHATSDSRRRRGVLPSASAGSAGGSGNRWDHQGGELANRPPSRPASPTKRRPKGTFLLPLLSWDVAFVSPTGPKEWREATAQRPPRLPLSTSRVRSERGRTTGTPSWPGQATHRLCFHALFFLFFFPDDDEGTERYATELIILPVGNRRPMFPGKGLSYCT